MPEVQSGSGERCEGAEARDPLMMDEPDLSIFENKTGLAEDMKFLASMPELCDVTFLVGETREPVCAVKAVLAARSRVFHKMLYQQPSPQRKKEAPPKENKLRQFLKRSSEPLLNLQNSGAQRNYAQQLTPIQEPTGMQHATLIIEEFEPDVFRQLIEYIHTGNVTLQPRTLLGVMNAADYYGLDELRRACNGFVQTCINVDTVCALLASAERYIQYKCTKTLVQKVLEFVDEHGNEVLNLGSFTLLPQHVVRLILAREELRADEFTKFQAALMWSKKYCDSMNQNSNSSQVSLNQVISSFLEYIHFHKIPANVLMKDIHPLGYVPYSIIMNALAYQADPTSVDPNKLSPNRVRRSAQGRSMSVQSSGGEHYGSNTTLTSSGSSEMVMGNSPCKECNEAQPKIAEPCESLRVPSTKEYRRCRQPPSTQRSYKRQPEQLRQPVSTPQPWDSQDPGHYRRLRRQPSSTQQSMRQPKQLRQPPSTQQSYTRKHEQLRQPVSIQHPWESQDLSTQHHRRLQQLPSTQHWLIVQIPSTQQHISSPSSPTLSFPTSPSPSPLPPLDWVPSTPSSLPWT